MSDNACTASMGCPLHQALGQLRQNHASNTDVIFPCESYTLPNWVAYTPPSVNLTAYPIRFYALSPIQLSHASSHPPSHAPSIAVRKQPIKLSNLYSNASLSVDHLEQYFSYRNGADQLHNRFGIEVDESSAPSSYEHLYVCGLGINQTYRRAVFEVCASSTQSKSTDLPMYSKNPTHDNEKNNGKQSLICEHWKKNGIPRISVENSTVGSQETSSPTLSVIAQSGMSQSLGLISVDGKNPWILDLRATDYLTGFLEHLSLIPLVPVFTRDFWRNLIRGVELVLMLYLC
ncbi:uncharacterized protein E5676_scaffold1185G00500 [Cucumis melo var. makuwa]|uniref:Beta-galactosidase n=1 Tax=Cucumis melo var. makuwa TaxID=1194695 RepID=A0A5D3DQX8_CUCMM|nr:uncharacterized protein E6C27_scaffold238G00630 [Cucumis melo var. makuwa]TYK26087.1 uncharacterized protein E5676_scaffold1185G00500 [Cucumis melo var. makuwa]